VWVRYRGDLPADQPGFAQGALAWATDGYFIGAALLPDAEIDDSQTHRDISTGVVSHTINFHERFDPREWLLLDHEVVRAGGGRIHGRATVFDERGALVATFTQDAMVRRFAGDRPRDERRVM
jgi:acyl-CoA thioesterase